MPAGRPSPAEPSVPFLLSDDEVAIQKVVREFAQARVTLEAAAERDRFDKFPTEAFGQAAELGLTSLLGADGAGATAFVLAMDELAQVDASLAAILAVHNAGRTAIPPGARVGTNVLSGEPVALLFAEEATGSDLAATGTLAVPSNGGYRITGQKVWALGAQGARHLLVLATVPGQGQTMFLVPVDAAGVSLGESEPILGLRAAGIRTVYLSGVEASADQALGGIGGGLAVASSSRVALQLGSAAMLCGTVAGALEAAARFAETRVQFGSPIGLYQAVSDAVAAMDSKLAAARALTLQAAAHADAADAAVWAARAKLVAADVGVAMTRQANRVQGGTGFMREGGTERFAREARVLQFLGEPAYIQKDTLKRAILDLPFPPAP
jgi:alkylation response protein AidB-like acyl-CoA dehydrogenase